MSSSTLEYLYGPLSQEYCLYFYALSVIGFLGLLTVVIYVVYTVLTSSKKLPIGFFMSMLMSVLFYGVFYFQNRLLHSMCARTLKKEGMADMPIHSSKPKKETMEDMPVHFGKPKKESMVADKKK
jgi:hypothetical protein